MARGRRRGARPGNSNDVDRVARRETPVGVSPPAAKRDGNGNTIGL